MRIFIVHAHPEPASLNGALTDIARSTLTGAGHKVLVSDLYAMRWKAAVDADDFGSAATHPLAVAQNSGSALASGDLAPEIVAEQDKLRWADAVILQFPLWWYSMPAIMKGWVDRVFTLGFGYGVGEHTERKYGERYGEGTLAGKRALLSVTIGGKESHYTDRGINGPIDDLLFPIQHGILYYAGLSVLPPHVMYATNRVSPEDFSVAAKAWRQRLLELPVTEPIRYRRQNGGDYEMPSLRLRAGLEDLGDRGFGLHARAARS